ncbi:MAG: transposase, partial [Bacillota bacterium]|nr:transposase [Bacillota bacterium]
YIPYYNRKFAVQASNPEKAYLPKRDMFELQLIFAKHETRKLDSGLSFSFKNQKYRLPVNVINNKVPASPHDTITVATSKYIGV